MDNRFNSILKELANYNMSFEENISNINALGVEVKTPIEQIKEDFEKVTAIGN